MKKIVHSSIIKGLMIPIILVFLWEAMSRRSVAYSYAFVPLASIWSSLIELLKSGELLSSLFATLQTTLIGILVGGGIGLFVGSLMGVSNILEKIIGPIYHAIRQVPLLGWIPLIGLWFGNGLTSKLLIVCLSTFYPMVLSTFEGLRNVEKKHIEVARVLRFSRVQLFCHVLLPGALPAILSGLMQALAFAWIATVGSELLFSVGPGLGGLMQTAESASRMDIVVLCVFTIGVTGFLLNWVVSALRSRMLNWRV